MSGHRVRVVERVAGRLQLRFERRVEPGTTLDFGRGGSVSIGVDPLDDKVSRRAATVSALDRGWRITPTNRSGVVLHLWGLAPYPIRHVETVGWHRVGVRVLGSPGVEHWILLEDSADYTAGVDSATTSGTHVSKPPPELTDEQREAVGLIFAQLLTWPPTVDAQVLLIKQAATRVQRSATTVQGRLDGVRAKALALGLGRTPELTDPEYLYVLVRAGYVPLRPEDVDPLLS